MSSIASITDFEGRLQLDMDSPEDAELVVSMKAASLWTGVPELDKHLKSADFFDVARHPRIDFRSTVVKRTGEKSAEVWGELTMLGITKPVTLDVTMTFAGDHPLAQFNANFVGKFVAGFRASARILRSDWGLSRGTPLVSDEIEIAINAELLRE
jgi:polyisoprenoid-binding protein YceI